MKKSTFDNDKVTDFQPNTQSSDKKNINMTFYKFFFGIKSQKANWLLFGGMFSLIIYCFLIILVRILIGLTTNFIQNGNLSELNFLCLIIAILGPVNSSICLLTGYFFKKHFFEIRYQYKKNYYNLVLKQAFSWFIKQDLNKLSKSIKNDIDKIEKGVNNLTI